MWGPWPERAKKGEEHLQGTERPFSPGVFIPSKLPDGAWENGKARLTASGQVRLDGGRAQWDGRVEEVLAQLGSGTWNCANL